MSDLITWREVHIGVWNGDVNGVMKYEILDALVFPVYLSIGGQRTSKRFGTVSAAKAACEGWENASRDAKPKEAPPAITWSVQPHGFGSVWCGRVGNELRYIIEVDSDGLFYVTEPGSIKDRYPTLWQVKNHCDAIEAKKREAEKAKEPEPLKWDFNCGEWTAFSDGAKYRISLLGGGFFCAVKYTLGNLVPRTITATVKTFAEAVAACENHRREFQVAT